MQSHSIIKLHVPHSAKLTTQHVKKWSPKSLIFSSLLLTPLLHPTHQGQGQKTAAILWASWLHWLHMWASLTCFQWEFMLWKWCNVLQPKVRFLTTILGRLKIDPVFHGGWWSQRSNFDTIPQPFTLANGLSTFPEARKIATRATTNSVTWWFCSCWDRLKCQSLKQLDNSWKDRIRMISCSALINWQKTARNWKHDDNCDVSWCFHMSISVISVA